MPPWIQLILTRPHKNNKSLACVRHSRIASSSVLLLFSNPVWNCSSKTTGGRGEFNGMEASTTRYGFCYILPVGFVPTCRRVPVTNHTHTHTHCAAASYKLHSPLDFLPFVLFLYFSNSNFTLLSIYSLSLATSQFFLSHSISLPFPTSFYLSVSLFPLSLS